MKKKVFIPVLILLVIVAAVAFAVSRRKAKDDGVIRVSGNIEVDDVEVSFRIPGRVLSRPAAEGSAITAGAPVAQLDPTELEHDAGVRAADVEAARAKLAELEAGSRPEEIEQARAAVRLAAAEEEHLANDAARARELAHAGIVSARDREAAETAYKAGHERTRQARENLSLAEKGPRKELIEAARAAVREAEEAVASARTRLSFTTLTSPVTGIVISENVEAGEQVAAGTPVITVGDLRVPWLRAYVDETDLGRIHLGQHVRITTDTFRGKAYDGTVAFISSEAEFTPRAVQTEKERVKLVYRIKINVANPNLELKPGMPADAEIRTAQ